MSINSKIYSLVALARNNKKIIENYFFMTILQVLNSFFYFLIYPFLIRTLGMESYGLFVFATSISTYFIFLVNFGFEMPALKIASENINDKKALSKLLSCVFTAKLILLGMSLLLISLLLYVIPILHSNVDIVIICFFQAIAFVLFPQWYFQAKQNMRIVTYIQLGLKILSLPFIFYFISSYKDLNLYALIVSLSSIIGGIIAFLIIFYNHKVNIKLVNIKELSSLFKDGLPFFLSNSAGVVKEQSITLIIGSYFGMGDVAIFDLANKISSVPRTILMSINGAIFPRLINNISSEKVKKLINYETFLSILVILLIALFGKYVVQYLGGIKMIEAYPLSILLSFSILVWLIVGAYISFIFVPNNKYFLATKNQIIALVSFITYTVIGFCILDSIFILGFAIALSGLTEILYCKYVTKKYKLL